MKLMGFDWVLKYDQEKSWRERERKLSNSSLEQWIKLKLRRMMTTKMLGRDKSLRVFNEYSKSSYGE